MLLRDLKGVNVLGLREVTLPYVPPSGIVALEFEDGRDPSLLPALLGFALEGSPDRARPGGEGLIRPGAGYAYVEVGLDREESGRLTILRGIDRKGALQASLREPERNEILSRRAEVDARIGELFAGDPGEMAGLVLGSGPAPGAKVGEDADAAGHLDELRAARKRLRHRLRRTTKRIKVLEDQVAEEEAEIGMEHLAEGRQLLLREKIEAFANAIRDPAPAQGLVVRVGEVEAAIRGMRSRLQGLGGRIGRLRGERGELSGRGERVAAYRARLRDLRDVMQRAGPAGEVGPVPVERDAGNERRLALVFGIVSACFLLMALLARFGTGLDGRLADYAFGALGIGVLLNAAVALHFLRRAQDEAGEPSVSDDEEPVDPLTLIEQIQAEYADVVPEYDADGGEALEAGAAAIDREIDDLEEEREVLEAAVAELEEEWAPVRARLPDAVLVEGGETGEPEGEATEIVTQCRRVIDEIRELTAATGPELPATARRALDALCDGLSEALSAAGSRGTPGEVLEAAGWEPTLLSAEAPERAERIDRLTGELRAQAAELSRTALEAVRNRPKGKKKRGKSVRLLEEARGRLAETEDELEPVLAALDRLSGKGKTPERKAESVASLGERLERIGQALKVGGGGPRFIVLTAEEAPPSARDLEELVERLAPSIEQVLVVARPGWGEGEGVPRFRLDVSEDGEGTFYRV